MTSLTARAPQLRVGSEQQPVLEHRGEDPLDVVGDHEPAPEARGERPRRALQRERAARARAELQVGVMPGRGDEIDDVAAQLGCEVHRVHGDRGVGDVGRAHHRLEVVGVHRALALGLEDHELGLAVRVAHRDPHQEPVELRLGQGIGALELDGVLGRDHHERPRQAVGVGVDGDLALLHRLEQRRLGLRRGAVDLVGEHDVGEHPAGPELELVGGAVPDRHAGDVGRQEVGGELDALAGAADRAGDRLGQRGLADARDVLDEEVPLGQHAHEGEVDGVALALDHSFDIGEQRLEQPAERRFAARRGSGLNHAGNLQGTNGDGTRGLRTLLVTVASAAWRRSGSLTFWLQAFVRRPPTPAPLVDGRAPGRSPRPSRLVAPPAVPPGARCRLPRVPPRDPVRRRRPPRRARRRHLPRVVPRNGALSA